MAAQIIVLYLLGIIFFILALEEELEYKSLIYAIVSFFLNIVGYYTSYSDTNYVLLAYVPEAFVILSVIIVIYRVYGYLPKDSLWGDDDEEEYKFKTDIEVN